jgi:uncharacterized membrane protein
MRSLQESITLLLNPFSLSESDRRYRGRFFQSLLYADGLVLVLVTFAFRKEWLLIFAVWFVASVALLSLYVRKVKTVVREKGMMTSPQQQAKVRNEVSRRLIRPIVLTAASGILLLFTGRYSSIGYVFGGVVLLVSLILYLLIRRMR